MKWMGLAITAMAACGHSGTSSNGSGATPGSGSGAGSSVAEPQPQPPDSPADDPTPKLVAKAFEDAVPAFPLLNTAGSTAAFGASSAYRGTDVTMYAVGFAEWGNANMVYIVDALDAKMMADAEGDEHAAMPIAAVIQGRAGAVKRRLADEKFTPFDHPAVHLQPGDNTVGPYKLKVERAPAGDLSLSLADASGNPRMTEGVKPRPMAQIADSDCVATPKPGSAWFDAARHRVLVSIDWTPGADVCETPDPDYKLWVVP